MARRQGHLVDFSHIPCRHYHPAGIGIVFQHFNHVRQLVYSPSVRSRPAPPLVSVYRTEITVFISPFIPDGNTVIFQIFYIRISRYEPQQFIYYRFQMNLLRSKQRKAFAQVKPHLIAEYALRTYSCPVLLHSPVLTDMPQQIQILLHVVYLVLNEKIIASSYTSPGRRTADGYSGLFGESGYFWHSIATPS